MMCVCCMRAASAWLTHATHPPHGRSYRAIYDTPAVQSDAARAAATLKLICWYAVLAPTSSDQITLLENTKVRMGGWVEWGYVCV